MSVVKALGPKQQGCSRPSPGRVTTYSSYLLATITLSWGMRSTQQPRDRHGASF